MKFIITVWMGCGSLRMFTAPPCGQNVEIQQQSFLNTPISVWAISHFMNDIGGALPCQELCFKFNLRFNPKIYNKLIKRSHFLKDLGKICSTQRFLLICDNATMKILHLMLEKKYTNQVKRHYILIRYFISIRSDNQNLDK